MGRALSAVLVMLVVSVKFLAAGSPLPQGSVSNLRTEHLRDPLGIDAVPPRFSWSVNLPHRGARQTAYHILVASSTNLLSQDRGDLWDSGRVTSTDPVLIDYAGVPLRSGQFCFWKVRIWDEKGEASGWSPVGMWSMGLLNAADWKAKWIGMTPVAANPAPPSPMLRKTFSISKPVRRATAYVCGLGYFDLKLNGKDVSDHVLQPTWTRYDLLANYVTFDVTAHLQQGRNAVGVELGNGFYNQWSRDAWKTSIAPWRALPQMILQMEIEYADGSTDRVVSDETWKASTGPRVLDAARMGEVYDARLEKAGWATPEYNDASWSPAVVREGAGNLVAPNSEPVRVVRTISPVAILRVPGRTNTWLLDFGENIAGWGRLTVKGPAGTRVRMVFGEETNRNGTISQRRINVHVHSHKEYFQTDTYVLKGRGVEIWEPRFTYHGFQYVQVEGLPSAPDSNTLVARVVNTDFEPAGTFLCSNDVMNRTETNTVRAFLGNFVGIPTDCPHREKNGWTGDAQLACEMGLTHFRSAAAYARWIREFRPAQRPDGKLAGVFPNAIWSYDMLDGPAWESAYLIIPWMIYQHCGDARVLTNNYEGMKAYVEHCRGIAVSNIVSYGLGDWCPAKTETPAAVTSTAYHYQNALILAEAAELTGRGVEAREYRKLAEEIRSAFQSRFYDPQRHRIANGSQTAQSAALYFGLAGKSEASGIAEKLADNVRDAGDTIDTGILGSKYLLRALCDNGHAETAMALAMQTNYPSWGHWITRGATTLWETWHGNGDIDSLNHVMFGDISAWFVQYVAGIRAESPGYKTILIKPEITGGLEWARATHESPYGTIVSSWRLEGRTVTHEITIPPGATARVHLPTLGTSATNLVIREGDTVIWRDGRVASTAPFVAHERTETAGAQSFSVWRVQSGSYRFVWNIAPPPQHVRVQAADRKVAVDWKPSPGATAYRIDRSTTRGGPYEPIHTVTRAGFEDRSVTNGQTYFYRVSAITADGCGAPSSELSGTPEAIANFSFETPRIADFEYTPARAAWAFSGGRDNGSGIAADDSGFTAMNHRAPLGSQVAFLQRQGSITQTVRGFRPGAEYTVTFQAAQRSGPSQQGAQSWKVEIDGNVLQTYAPARSATNYSRYFASFVASAPAHTLRFVGTSARGDNTVFLDDIRITPELGKD